MTWTVYVLVSQTSRSTYVGIALDAERRVAQHNGIGRGGAKATRAGRPWKLVARFGPFESRGEAQRIEWQVKRLRGRARLAFRVPG